MTEPVRFTGLKQGDVLGPWTGPNNLPAYSPTISCSHWGMFPIQDTTYQRLNFGPELT